LNHEVALTFDVERDCPPFAETTLGMERGLPWIMDVLEDAGVKGTFLFTAKIAERFPELARRAAKKHELGCHGLEHERFDKLSVDEGRDRLRAALEILRRFGRVTSFRAPNFQLPDRLYPVLSELGITVDSTKAVHKGWKGGITWIGGVLEVPASTTSIVTRMPWSLQVRFHRRFSSRPLVVYMFHPWEFVRMPRRLRPDCWFGTGENARKNLQRLLKFHLERDARFVTLRDVYEEHSDKAFNEF